MPCTVGTVEVFICLLLLLMELSILYGKMYEWCFVFVFCFLWYLLRCLQTLKTASPPDEDFDCSIARLPDNVSKNRSKSNLPCKSLIYLSCTSVPNVYLCVFV